MSKEQADLGRVTGEAAWKAHQEELDRRNAAAKKTAHVHPAPQEVAVWARQRRLARAEELQLEALNQRIAAGRHARA